MKRNLLCFILPLILVTSVIAQNDYPEISMPDLMKKKQLDKNIIILDVRTDGEYYDTASRNRQINIGRIKDAKHIELQKLMQDPSAIEELQPFKENDIYVICSHSYRSRRVTNLLKSKGFTRVTNVSGGMTEWFRRYEDLAAYREANYETTIPYKNISAAELFKQLAGNKKPLLIGINNDPRFFYDSMNVSFYRYYPAFRNAKYFRYADSLKVLETISTNPGQQVILFNLINTGAAELAGWLKAKGVDASYLVGGSYYFYDYVLNHHKETEAAKFMENKSMIKFISVSNFCTDYFTRKNSIAIDLRPDSVFNKKSDGMKWSYTKVKGSVNFDQQLGIDKFIASFPEKTKDYVFISDMGISGIELADALAKKGYRIHWLNGGIHQVDWINTNMENSPCPVLE